MQDLGYGAGYEYDHSTEEAFSGQNYFPTPWRGRIFIAPADDGFEKEIEKRLAYWAKLRAQKNDPLTRAL
jgi:putative ATPase